jgi:uncharacterized protein involved in exopolysaccharide biosynthesis
MFLLYGLFGHAYTAEMKILLRRGRLDVPMSAEPSSFPLRYEVTEEDLNSEAELLRDGDTARKVVLAANLQQQVGWRPWRKTAESRVQHAVDLVLRRLRVEPLRKTRLLRVSYSSSDPELAANVLQALANVYMEKHLAAHRPSGEFEFFERQATKARERLDLNQELMRGQNDRGSVEPALQRDLVLQRLVELENTYQQLLVSIAETETRIHALEQSITEYPETKTVQVRRADNAQLLEKLKSTLLTLELRKTEMATRFQPEYRLRQEVDQQIQQTKAAIASESLNPVRDETTSPDPQHEWAKSEMERSQVELQALQSRAAGLFNLLAVYRASGRQLGREALIRADLQREGKNLEDTYQLLAEKREQARIGDALDERRVLNATIVQAPVVPARPDQSPITLGALGLLAAGIVSTGLAFAADALDPTFRGPEDVVHYLGVPLLASLPTECPPHALKGAA